MEKACGLHCIKINNIGVKFGKEIALKNVNIHIHCGELTVIIGRNGAGKSTLLKAILGEIEHTGNITFVDQRDNLAKKIKKISQTVQPNHSEAPVSEKMWIDIEVLMMEVYPSVIKVLKDAGLSPSEMHLCFLTLFKLDSTAISILLNIIPTSVDRTRLRVRKKLNWEGKQGLYESLVNI